MRLDGETVASLEPSLSWDEVATVLHERRKAVLRKADATRVSKDPVMARKNWRERKRAQRAREAARGQVAA